MRIRLRALTHEDVEAHNAGEDEETVRWVTGTFATADSTAGHVDKLAANASAGPPGLTRGEIRLTGVMGLLRA
jgi:hypothetical protein